MYMFVCICIVYIYMYVFLCRDIMYISIVYNVYILVVIDEVG